MEESELLTHFAPFLRRSIPSTSRRSIPAPVTVDTRMEECYSPPRNNNNQPSSSLLTPSPSPHPITRPSRPVISTAGIPTRVSPSGSTSSNESGLTEDRGSDSSAAEEDDDEDMEMMDDHHHSSSQRDYYSQQQQQQQQTSRPSSSSRNHNNVNTRRRQSPLSTSSHKYSTAIPASIRRSSSMNGKPPSSAPITPTDELSHYSLGASYIPTSTSSSHHQQQQQQRLPLLQTQSQQEPIPTPTGLRTQRSGSFLKMLEVGKNMLSGNGMTRNGRSSNSISSGTDVVDILL